MIISSKLLLSFLIRHTLHSHYHPRHCLQGTGSHNNTATDISGHELKTTKLQFQKIAKTGELVNLLPQHPHTRVCSQGNRIPQGGELLVGNPGRVCTELVGALVCPPS